VIGNILEPTHFLLLMLVLLLLFGAKKLPELGRGMGEFLRELRNPFEEPQHIDEGDEHDRV
jgi:sec-independent protein translocase protein TatA